MQAVAREAAEGLGRRTQPHAVVDDFLARAQVVGVDTSSLRAEAEALKTAARGDWIVGRTGGGRTADAQGKTVTGQYRDDEIFWLRDERAARYGLRALPALWRAVDQLVARVNDCQRRAARRAALGAGRPDHAHGCVLPSWLGRLLVPR